MDVSKEITTALAAIENETEEEEQRARYRRSMKVLRTIPSGTADADLTLEQSKAWTEHDSALEWLHAHT